MTAITLARTDRAIPRRKIKIGIVGLLNQRRCWRLEYIA